jgi:hypothetical protein
LVLLVAIAKEPAHGNTANNLVCSNREAPQSRASSSNINHARPTLVEFDSPKPMSQFEATFPESLNTHEQIQSQSILVRFPVFFCQLICPINSHFWVYSDCYYSMLIIVTNVKVGLINPSRLINRHCPIFFCNLETGGPPRLINRLAWDD